MARSIYHHRYAAKISTENRFTQVSLITGISTTSSWAPAGGVTLDPSSTYGRWYTAQYERSREITPPADDASRVCPSVGSSSFNTASTTTYEVRWTLGNPLIACTIEYALRTRNNVTGVFTYGSFSSITVDSSTPQQTVTIPLPAVANDSNAFIYRFCFRPFSSHTT
jgi:hypothetical protein